ncbi:hypothetical protein FHL15_010235 [Xylaria flabelliformis]|uniref:Uncharacterized protein n=1 Tax=Xylaria flabelliformis TaxID=2512241 RepID=A0A553HLQ7_9PEZI|nr:hypothetical protein FHL15_010235 [Xylaria flabelliformis]
MASFMEQSYDMCRNSRRGPHHTTNSDRAAAEIVAREEANAVQGLPKAEVLRKRADECLSHIKARRELYARTAKTVATGEYDVGTGDDSITTAGLATCFGVAVTGHWSEGTSGEFDRTLSHTYADSAKTPEVLEAFGDLLQDVSEVKGSGWTKEDIDAYNEEYGNYVAAITQTVGVAPEEKKHDYEEVWRLKINSDKSINCGPEGGSNKC